jgi:hypothetical protein
MVESQPSKLLVAGSIPVSRSKNPLTVKQLDGRVAQMHKAVLCSFVHFPDLYVKKPRFVPGL